VPCSLVLPWSEVPAKSRGSSVGPFALLLVSSSSASTSVLQSVCIYPRGGRRVGRGVSNAT
jgi:hypothetical protein